MTASDDDQCFDAVADLGRLSERQLLERLVRGQSRMENAISTSSEYMTAALESLDTQMGLLQQRMAGDAAFLAEQIRLVREGQADTVALDAAAARVQATAEVVAGLDLPSDVGNEDNPADGDIPDDPNGPGGGGETPGDPDNPPDPNA